MIRFAALLAIMATSATAELCLPRDEMAKGLLKLYGESVAARLLTSSGKEVIEVFTAPNSWTMIVTDAAGKACIIADGKAWVIQGIPQGTPG